MHSTPSTPSKAFPSDDRQDMLSEPHNNSHLVVNILILMQEVIYNHHARVDR